MRRRGDRSKHKGYGCGRCGCCSKWPIHKALAKVKGTAKGRCKKMEYAIHDFAVL